jgi:hypothetical protein
VQLTSRETYSQSINVWMPILPHVNLKSDDFPKMTLSTINQSIICIMVVFSSLFRLVIDLSVPFRISTSNFTFGVFKRFLMKTEHHNVGQNYIFSIIFSKHLNITVFYNLQFSNTHKSHFR